MISRFDFPSNKEIFAAEYFFKRKKRKPRRYAKNHLLK